MATAKRKYLPSAKAGLPQKVRPTKVKHFYAWHHKETGERIGWVFASAVKAKEWWNSTYPRYPKFPRIDDYYATLRTDAVRKFSSKYWYRDKKMYESYELRRGWLSYVEKTKTQQDTSQLGRRKLKERWAKRCISFDGRWWRVKFTWKRGVFDLGKFMRQDTAEKALYEQMIKMKVLTVDESINSERRKKDVGEVPSHMEHTGQVHGMGERGDSEGAVEQESDQVGVSYVSDNKNS